MFTENVGSDSFCFAFVVCFCCFLVKLHRNQRELLEVASRYAIFFFFFFFGRRSFFFSYTYRNSTLYMVILSLKYESNNIIIVVRVCADVFCVYNMYVSLYCFVNIVSSHHVQHSRSIRSNREND